MTELHITKCKKCKAEFLVGVDGKDIKNAETGGDSRNVPFLSIGQGELDNAPELNIKNEYPCPTCKNPCKIITIKNMGK